MTGLRPPPPWLGSPVNADSTQVQDACRAHHDIQSDKDVTVNPAEFPLAHHLGTKHQKGWAADEEDLLGQIRLQAQRAVAGVL